MTEPATVFWNTTSPSTSDVPVARPTFDGDPDAAVICVNVPPPLITGAVLINSDNCAASFRPTCHVTRYVPTDGRINSVLLVCAAPGLLMAIPPTAGADARGKLNAEPAATLGGAAETATVAA